MSRRDEQSRGLSCSGKDTLMTVEPLDRPRIRTGVFVTLEMLSERDSSARIPLASTTVNFVTMVILMECMGYANTSGRIEITSETV